MTVIARTMVTALCMALLLVFPASAGSDNVVCSSECRLEQVRAYFRALDKVFRKGSTVADVDDLFSALHGSVRYVHGNYEADFDRQAWRAAFIGNLERGAYRNGPERRIGIQKVIHGKNHIAVEYSHGEVLADGTWKGSEPLLALFRFMDGRISLIEELW